MTADIEDYEKFVREDLRRGSDYFEALEKEQLAGFFCVIPVGRDVELGLGLRPDLCGKGWGRAFLGQILRFLEENYTFESCILSVAAFNQRAIKVYRACGFEDCGVTMRNTNGGEYAFLTMKKKGKIVK